MSEAHTTSLKAFGLQLSQTISLSIRKHPFFYRANNMLYQSFCMDYNTSRSTLIFREYGRNIQRIVDYAVSLEDDERRQEVVEYVIGLMGQMNPHLKNVEQFRHKLWDHLFMMSQFRLDAESPYPPYEPEPEGHVALLPYPKSDLRFKHYGKNVEQLIVKAISMEDEDKKREFTKVIGNYMKMVYKNNNNDSVDDETIREDLYFLSDGKLQLDIESNLDRLSRSNRNKRKKNMQNNDRNHHHNNNRGGYRRNNNYGNNYGNNNNRNNYGNNRNNYGNNNNNNKYRR